MEAINTLDDLREQFNEIDYRFGYLCDRILDNDEDGVDGYLYLAILDLGKFIRPTAMAAFANRMEKIGDRYFRKP